MRHNKKFNHLGRTASHRSAMLANMAISLIMHKRITTTVAKAKALKKYVEPLITKAKEDSTNSVPVATPASSSLASVRVMLHRSASSSSSTSIPKWQRTALRRRPAVRARLLLPRLRLLLRHLLKLPPLRRLPPLKRLRLNKIPIPYKNLDTREGCVRDNLAHLFFANRESPMLI